MIAIHGDLYQQQWWRLAVASLVHEDQFQGSREESRTLRL